MGADRQKQSPHTKKKENPFDKFANPRKKHEILNRKVKGENRNVGRARAKAIDERKNKLLKDYKNSKKSNSFTDKRFGENDTDLSLEEKMFMRFQKEKVKKSRNASLFNLDNEEIPVLTHKGKILSEENLNDGDWQSDEDEDENDTLGKDVVNQLHFGGGLVQKTSKITSSDLNVPPPQSRAEMLQDVIMKSKLRKLEKKEAKEAQDNSTELIDSAFSDLVSSSLLKFNPLKRDRSERDANEKETPFSDYDVALRTMAYETKVQATDRTKSEEELALEARKKLEELEAARLKRMKAPAIDNVDEEDIKNAFKDSKKKKRGRVTDDDIEDDGLDHESEDENEDEDEVDEDEENDDDEDEEEEDDWEDEDEGEEGDAAVDVQGDSDEDGEERIDVGEDEDESGSEGDEVDDDDESDANSTADEPVAKQNKKLPEANNHNAQKIVPITKKTANTQKSLSDVNEAMPHNIECPLDMEAFSEFVDTYVSNAKDMKAFLDRVVAWNSIHLPGAQGQENRSKLHNFLDMILRHTVKVGDKLSCSTKEKQSDLMQQVDYLSVTVFRLTRDLTNNATSCVALWGRLLKSFHTQLLKRLRDYVQEERAISCWPSLGTLLVLKNIRNVFSISDHHNAIIVAATLFLCQCLSQCPIQSQKDIASGLFICAILLEYTAETAPPRLVPEVITFVRAAARLLSPIESEAKSKAILCTIAEDVVFLRSKDLQISSENDENVFIGYEYFNDRKILKVTEQFSLGSLNACLELSKALLQRHGSSDAVPEILSPLLDALKLIRPSFSPSFPVVYQEKYMKLVEDVSKAIAEIQKTRSPLLWRVKEKTAIASLTPRFQTNYVPTKDTDPDKARVKLKQMTRELKREKKAAMRELTRDAAFLDQERYKEQTEAIAKRKAERAKNFAWMEEQQATLNQQVKKGGGLMKGGGSSVVKRPRVKR